MHWNFLSVGNKGKLSIGAELLEINLSYDGGFTDLSFDGL